MEIERGRIIEIVVSVLIVGLFVALLVGIGGQFGQDGLDADGGLAIVGAILAFVLVMAGVGIGLAYMLNSEDADT